MRQAESREHEEEKDMRATVYHGPRDMRIDQVPAGYDAMDSREAIKVMVRP